ARLTLNITGDRISGKEDAMSAVSLADAEGLDPLPICRRNREWLVNNDTSPEAIVLRFFSDALPIRQRDKSEEDHSIKHLRECPRCRDWVATIVSDATYRRHARRDR